MVRYFVFALILNLIPTWSLAAESISADHVKVRILAPDALKAGEETLLAVSFEPDSHWHVYWKNPGDSGAAPKFEIKSEQASFGPILWPIPARLPVAHLTNLGYEGAVAYPFSITPQADAKQVELSVKLEWLVCQEECIPGFGTLTLKRPIEANVRWNAKNEEIVKKFAARIPTSASDSPFQLQIEKRADGVNVKTQPPTSGLSIFPVDSDSISPATPTEENGTYQFKFLPGGAQRERFGFVVGNQSGAWEFEDVQAQTQSSTNTTPFWILIASALLGGVILNLMPCVFPVISIKAFSLLKTEGSARVRDCLQYSAGVVTTFAALGIAFLVLRSLGSAVGWGFQLQSPVVILLLIVLFWLMALNFLGVFEFGTSVMNVAGRSRWNSSFGTGVLSVFIAAPCTGPFMGTALGAASTLPMFLAFLIFIFLGLGLAFPFLLFAAFPSVLRWLPKPGPWMETVKQFFAFPLFATVIWLLWVLGQQSGSQGWFVASLAIFGISFAIWMGLRTKTAGRVLAWIFALVTIAFAGAELRSIEATPQTVSKNWQAYDAALVEAARREKKAVFIDFTAAWCITCQVNKQAVLDTEAGQKAFKDQNVTLIRADWTRYDEKITTALTTFGRNSVPVYVFYPADGSEPKILPQILTLAMIENLNALP